jgi:hypothetical protein
MIFAALNWWRNRNTRMRLRIARKTILVLAREKEISPEFAVHALDEIKEHEKTNTLPAWVDLASK